MALTRAALNTYLANQYAALATLTSSLSTDTETGYGPALDDTFLMMGVDYADLSDAEVEAGYELAARALARYHALKHFAQKLAAKTDPAVSGASASFRKEESKQLAQVRALLADAAREAASYGYSVSVSGGPGLLKSVQYNPEVPFRTEGLLV